MLNGAIEITFQLWTDSIVYLRRWSSCLNEVELWLHDFLEKHETNVSTVRLCLIRSTINHYFIDCTILKLM